MIFEFTKAKDGVNIRVARLEPVDDIIGIVQIVHGFGEGIEHYQEVTEFFVKHGYACVIHDQRGCGKLHKGKGVTTAYNCLLSDITPIRDKINEWYPSKTVFLYGFSFGGNIAINHLLKYGELNYAKAIIESPWFDICKPLPKYKSIPVRVFGFLNSKITASTGPYTNSDIEDGKYQNRISFRLLTKMGDSGRYAIKNAAKISLPMLLMCTHEDNVVSLTRIRKFLDNANDNVKFVEYSEGSHRLHCNLTADKVLNEILAYIDEE